MRYCSTFSKSYVLVLLALLGILAPQVTRAQFDYGTGADGAYLATGNDTLLAKVWNFTSFTIPAGDTITVVGDSSPLILKCNGSVVINGVLTLAGQPGVTGNTQLNMDFDGTYVAYGDGTYGTVYTGGAGGGGGGQLGGNGGNGYQYSLGDANPGGSAGKGNSFANVFGNVDGGTYSDGFGGNNTGGDYPNPNANGEGGDGASYGTPGFPGKGNYFYFYYFNGGYPGVAPIDSTYGNPTLTDTLINQYSDTGYDTTSILGGSGGGGGGSHNSTSTSTLRSGCGGGGGGGGVQITAYTIALGANGLLTVRGGDGGSQTSGTGVGGGGGGSGGTIYLKYLNALTGVIIDSTPLTIANSTINYGGGLGGRSSVDTGGRGGQGRYLAVQDVCVTPTTQAGNVTVTTANSTSLTVQLTRGNGNGGVLVVARASTSGNVAPTPGTAYVASSTFGSGGATGTGNYVVYSGSGNGAGNTYSFLVTGLTAGTTYTFEVYEYGAPSCYNVTPNSGSGTPFACTPPIAYNVTGGGVYCSGTGKGIFLSGSQDTVLYQLILNGSTLIGNPVSGTDAPFAFPAQTAIGVYTVSAATNSGCIGNMAGSASISAGSPPTINVSGPSPICLGDTLKINASGGAIYHWSGPGGFTSSAADTFIANATALNGGDYFVTVTDANGCSANNAVGIIVNSIGATTATSNSPVCSNRTLTLNATGGATYQWNGPNNYTASGATQNISQPATAATGTYTVTISNINGCHVTDTVKVTVLAAPQTTITTGICQGGNYAGHTAAGNFVDTFTAANGCDSIRTLILSVTTVVRDTIITAVCQGGSYLGHNTAGTYSDTFTATGGCDSIRTLYLGIKPVIRDTVTQTICSNLSYSGHNTAGTFIDTFNAANGCDSIRTLFLTVKQVSYDTVTQTICSDKSYAGYSLPGVYRDTFTAVNGCDSIRTLNLFVHLISADTVTTSICSGQSYAGHNTSGTFVDTYVATNGCDSIRTLNLSVVQQLRTSISQTICAGLSFDGHNTTGTFTDTFTSSGSCDSIRTLHLTVTPNVIDSFTESICEGNNYGGHTATGIYKDTFASHAGCDSIRTINLTVIPAARNTVKQIICIGTSFQGHTQSGFYYDTLSSLGGCDSIVTLELDFYPPSVPVINQSGDTLSIAPEPQYQWFLDSIALQGDTGQSIVITQHGSYYVQVTDSNGCKGSSAIYPAFTTGINTAAGSRGLSIYPNPTTGLFNIQLAGLTINRPLNIKLYNALGQQMCDKTQTLPAKEYNTQLDMTPFAKGVYLLQIQQDGWQTTRKIILE